MKCDLKGHPRCYKAKSFVAHSLKKVQNFFKTDFANSFSFSFSLFYLEGREKGKRITGCRTFGDPIDFYPISMWFYAIKKVCLI